jgi:tetratricopeptide (TPR) repeat protein
MGGTEISLLVALAIMVVGGLFYSGKLGNFKLKKKGKDLELDIQAPDTNARNLPSTPQPSPDINIKIDNEGFKKEIEDKLQNHFEKVEDLVKQGTKKDPETDEEINALNREIAALQNKLENTEQALEERKKVFAETEKALESEQIKSVVPEDQLAQAHEKLEEGDSSQAEELFKQILQEAEIKAEAGAEAAFQLAKFAKDRIDYREALRFYEKALHFDPENALYLNELGFMLFTLAHYDKAIEYYDKALAHDLKTYGEDHPSVASSWNNLGSAWKSKDEYDKAIEYFEKALRFVEKTGLQHRVDLVKSNIAALKKDRDD